MKKTAKIIILLLLTATLLLCLAACNGKDGQNGQDGLSAYELYVKHYPDYTGTEKEWVDDLANGNLARFTVTFVTNGGSVTGSLNVRKSVLLKRPAAPVKEDYEFGGWYTDNDFVNEWDFDTDTVTGNLTLYARWTFTEGLTYVLINNGAEYSVSGIGSATDAYVVIPPVHNGLAVAEIEGKAFEDCDFLISVAIPSTVARIGYWAFNNCSSLTDIKLPDGIADIGQYVFDGCTALDNITIPNSVKRILHYAFRNCTSLVSITIPSSVKEIWHSAFENCDSLTKITIPNSVVEIGRYVFSGDSLETIHVKGYEERPAGWDGNWYTGSTTICWNCKHI